MGDPTPIVWTNPLPASTDVDMDIIYGSLTQYLGQAIPQAGSAAVTTDASGAATVPFAQTFPTATLWAAVSPIGTAGWWATPTAFTPSSVSFKVWSAAGAVVSTAMTVGFIAVGN